MKKAKKTLAPSPARNVISHCNFNTEAFVPNKHTTAAAVALARAAEMNANAIAAIAKLANGPDNNSTAIYIGNDKT